MAVSTRIRDYVLTAKDKLAVGREKLYRQHASGSPGIQVCAFQADLMDAIILEIYEAALRDLNESHSGGLAAQVALVPHGGYGRRDVAPYSDVDLLLLHKASARNRVTRLAKRLVTDISDVGLQLGFSVRTPAVACQMAKRDPIIFSSQAESRFLAGSVRLYASFMRRFRRVAKTRRRALIHAICGSRREERVQYGETVFLLEPNVKRSRGGLRDIQTLRWVGFARYGESDPQSLSLMGVLSEPDERRLRRANEFLLRLRNELHFHSNKAYDVLYRSEQVRIAQLWGYGGGKGMLPVEEFMRKYFGHTSAVRNIVSNFVDSAGHSDAVARMVAPLVSRTIGGDYRVGPIHIKATKRGCKRLRGDLAEVLRLMALANYHDKRIEHQTWQAIRADMMGNDEIEVSELAADRFLALLSQTPRLGDLLRRLHELRVLEKMIVGMKHARCLLQFNRYHKYTVDEHSIRAIEQATDFLRESHTLGDAYRSIQRRDILHLALLVHDMGKGYADDHSLVGRDLAEKTARRLRLKQHSTETLLFLVEKHLIMSHLAFRRDTSSESVIVQFAREVGSIEWLRMLFVLTCADIGATGPGALNRWKIEVLSNLYQRTARHLGDETVVGDDHRLIKRRRKLKASVPTEHASWYVKQIDALPRSYLLDTRSAELISDLERVREVSAERAVAWGRYNEERSIVQYTIGAHEEMIPGIFHRLTGVISSHGLEIVSAEILTLADKLVLDRFYVHHHDYEGAPPSSRFESISASLVRALAQPDDTPPTFRQTWHDRDRRNDSHLEFLPTRISIDNTTSSKYTIVDVFTHDRTGLLYAISRALYEASISVCIAKIGTYLDQVVDVFYVTQASGEKIEEEHQLDALRQTLLRSIEEREKVT